MDRGGVEKELGSVGVAPAATTTAEGATIDPVPPTAATPEPGLTTCAVCLGSSCPESVRPLKSQMENTDIVLMNEIADIAQKELDTTVMSRSEEPYCLVETTSLLVTVLNEVAELAEGCNRKDLARRFCETLDHRADSMVERWATMTAHGSFYTVQ